MMKACRSCGSSDLHLFLSLGEVPLADGLLSRDELETPERRYPLDVALCSDCALVQILETVPPEVLFCQDYPYYSSFSDVLLRHTETNATRLMESRKLDSSSLVVELASNDGYMLQYFLRDGIPVLGIDPAEGPARAAETKGVTTLQTFFGCSLAEQLRQEGRAADVIIANNVLAHVADPNGFVEGIRILLKDEGVAVIEVPYLRDLIEHCEFDTIYHEHLCYFSVTALSRLFRRHDMSLNHVEQYPIHGGSLRLFVTKQTAPRDSVKRLLQEEQQAEMASARFYEDFASRVMTIKSQLTDVVQELTQRGKRLAAYGAAAKGATLLNYVGIGRERIDFVADRNVHKQGRFMPGVRIPIVDPTVILEQMPDYLLLLAWNFRDEIISQQQTYHQRGGQFIVPIPTLEIV
jgi:SAM-dependent methyltransferase